MIVARDVVVSLKVWIIEGIKGKNLHKMKAHVFSGIKSYLFLLHLSSLVIVTKVNSALTLGILL